MSTQWSCLCWVFVYTIATGSLTTVRPSDTVSSDPNKTEAWEGTTRNLQQENGTRQLLVTPETVQQQDATISWEGISDYPVPDNETNQWEVVPGTLPAGNEITPLETIPGTSLPDNGTIHLNTLSSDNRTTNLEAVPGTVSPDYGIFPREAGDSVGSEGKDTIDVRGPGFSELPRAIALPSSATSVASLCVCDLLVARCDVNCCCDPDCSASDFSLFSECSVPVVTVDSQLCTQETVLYSMSSSNTPERLVQSVELVNPSVFCIQATNYQPGLSYIAPDVPSESNFDNLLKEFDGISFNTETVAQNLIGSSGSSNAARYEYGSPIMTADAYLNLPAPLGTNECTDNNPVGFLVSQDFSCSRSAQTNCSSPALTLGTYTNVAILTTPNSGNKISITVTSITRKSLAGILIPSALLDYLPTFDNVSGVCTDVVLGVNYLVTYTEQGEILHVSASFILGEIKSAMGPIQQNFQISFTQKGTTPSPLSGSPGYVVGLPVVAGFKSPQYPFFLIWSTSYYWKSGIIHSTNIFGQLTILKSSSEQNCLTEEGNRTAVLFGYNMVSGCKLRYPLTTPCQVVSDTILNALKGQQFPEYVASFGNSQPQNVLDWVPVTVIRTTAQEIMQGMCKIPVSLELEVRWTKYGSLVNPQAKIVNVTEKVSYNFIQIANSGSEKTLSISTSVTFLDVSAPAEPGYKAQPSIDATLPYDFFRPFV
ncbi:tectonic-1 [Rhinophrynus dorsalis]